MRKKTSERFETQVHNEKTRIERMIQKLKKSSGRAVGFKFSGELADNEYKEFIAEIERIIADQGKIRLLMAVDYPQDFDLKAAWDDVVFWIKHIRDIDRLAIVGQKEWEKSLELLAEPFIHTDVKYYKTSDIEDAWNWIKSPEIAKAF